MTLKVQAVLASAFIVDGVYMIEDGGGRAGSQEDGIQEYRLAVLPCIAGQWRDLSMGNGGGESCGTPISLPALEPFLITLILLVIM